jgi:hypothetical protein
MDNFHPFVWLFILAIPIACISWTFTQEEVFREPHEYCVKKSKECRTLVARKFFFLFTCEYCLSHYITILLVLLTRYHLFINNWVGYFIAGFSLVWVANIYMTLFAILRQILKKTKLKNDRLEEDK